LFWRYRIGLCPRQTGSRKRSKADRIKEALGWLKVVFAALVAVDISLIAWLAQNFQSAENVLVMLAFIAVVCTTAAIVGVNHAAYKRIAELENL